MKIEIEVTPEEFKELFVPGKTQQKFMEQMFLEWQKVMMANSVPDFSRFWTGGSSE